MSYVLIFCQNKDLIKRNYCGKHKYSICRCQVINFQSFAYQFSPFWEVLGSKLHQIWFSFTETLWEIKTLFENFWRTQNLRFWSNFNFPFHLNIAGIEKKKKKNSLQKKLQLIVYPNMTKLRFYLFYPFREKYDYFLHYLGYLWQETGRVYSQRVRIKIWHIMF